MRSKASRVRAAGAGRRSCWRPRWRSPRAAAATRCRRSTPARIIAFGDETSVIVDSAGQRQRQQVLGQRDRLRHRPDARLHAQSALDPDPRLQLRARLSRMQQRHIAGDGAASAGFARPSAPRPPTWPRRSTPRSPRARSLRRPRHRDGRRERRAGAVRALPGRGQRRSWSPTSRRRAPRRRARSTASPRWTCGSSSRRSPTWGSRRSRSPSARRTPTSTARRCLTQLSARYNASLRATLINDGRHVGLAIFDELISALARYPGLNGFSNTTDAACDHSEPGRPRSSTART